VSWAALFAALVLGTGSIAAGDERYRIVKVTHYGKHSHHHKTKRACKRHGDRHCRKHVHRRRVPRRRPAPQPVARPAPVVPPRVVIPKPTPTPAPTATPTPTPTATPPPLPSRTSVDLTDDDADGWRVTPAYDELQAGPVEFNATNLGMDDHDFTVRDAQTTLGSIPLTPGASDTLLITLTPGVYTLYCSLPTHEARGMRADVTIR
jgi:hypothetical protein